MPADTLGFFLPSTITSQWPSKTVEQRCQGYWSFRAEERVILPSGWWLPKNNEQFPLENRGSTSRSLMENSPEESPKKHSPDLAWSNPAQDSGLFSVLILHSSLAPRAGLDPGLCLAKKWQWDTSLSLYKGKKVKLNTNKYTFFFFNFPFLQGFSIVFSFTAVHTSQQMAWSKGPGSCKCCGIIYHVVSLPRFF